MVVDDEESGDYIERFRIDDDASGADPIERWVSVQLPESEGGPDRERAQKPKKAPKAKPRAESVKRWKSQACTAVDRLADSTNHMVRSIEAARANRYGDALRQAERAARDARAARRSGKAATDWRRGRALVKEIKDSATYKLNAIEFLTEGYWLGDASLIKRANYWVKRGNRADRGIVAEGDRLRIRCWAATRARRPRVPPAQPGHSGGLCATRS